MPKNMAQITYLYHSGFVVETKENAYSITREMYAFQKALAPIRAHIRTVNKICRKEGILAPSPLWLDNYRVCIVDASNESKSGSNGADYRLHYFVELFQLGKALANNLYWRNKRMITKIIDSIIECKNHNAFKKCILPYEYKKSLQDCKHQFLVMLKPECFAEE